LSDAGAMPFAASSPMPISCHFVTIISPFTIVMTPPPTFDMPPYARRSTITNAAYAAFVTPMMSRSMFLRARR